VEGTLEDGQRANSGSELRGEKISVEDLLGLSTIRRVLGAFRHLTGEKKRDEREILRRKHLPSLQGGFSELYRPELLSISG